MRILM